MLIGLGCAGALLAVIVVRYRAGKVDWLVLSPMVIVVAGLLTTRSAVWAVPRPPGLVTTAFENAELALCGMLSLGLVLWFGWVYHMTGENRMAARRAARTPVNELHISRAGTWRDSEANPIAREEWEQVAERNGLGLYDPHGEQAREDAIAAVIRDTGLDRAGAEKRLASRAREQEKVQVFLASRPDLIAKYPREAEISLPGRAAPKKTFTLTRADGSRLTLQWDNSQVTIIGAGPDWAADAALVTPLARALNASVYSKSGALIS
jgi:hypothetical protein